MSEWRTVCHKCAKEGGLEDRCSTAVQHVLAGQGPDSVCDFCGQENGGAVIRVSPEERPTFERHTATVVTRAWNERGRGERRMLAIEVKGKWLENTVGLSHGDRLVVRAREGEIEIRPMEGSRVNSR